MMTIVQNATPVKFFEPLNGMVTGLTFCCPTHGLAVATSVCLSVMLFVP